MPAEKFKFIFLCCFSKIELEGQRVVHSGRTKSSLWAGSPSLVCLKGHELFLCECYTPVTHTAKSISSCRRALTQPLLFPLGHRGIRSGIKTRQRCASKQKELGRITETKNYFILTSGYFALGCEVSQEKKRHGCDSMTLLLYLIY